MGRAKMKGVILIPTSQNWHSPSKGPFFRPFLFPPKKPGPHTRCHRLIFLARVNCMQLASECQASVSAYFLKRMSKLHSFSWRHVGKYNNSYVNYIGIKCIYVFLRSKNVVYQDQFDPFKRDKIIFPVFLLKNEPNHCLESVIEGTQ